MLIDYSKVCKFYSKKEFYNFNLGRLVSCVKLCKEFEESNEVDVPTMLKEVAESIKNEQDLKLNAKQIEELVKAINYQRFKTENKERTASEDVLTR